LWRKNCWCLGLTAIFLLSLVSAVRINEVMPRTPTSIYGDNCEWIELYGQNENLTDYAINTTNEKANFSVYIENYIIITKNKTAFMQNWNVSENKIIEWRGMSLVDSGEGIFLFDNLSILINSISYPSFSSYENKTYSLLSNLSWIICNEPTPGRENLCQSQQNQTQNQTNQTTNQTSLKIYINLTYDKEVENEFEVEVNAFNLNGSYDVKIYLTFENNETIISETYNGEENKWMSSNYYVEKILEGYGNKSESLKLRLQDNYENHTGGVLIWAKIRKNGISSIIDEFSDNIIIIKEEVTEEENKSEVVSEVNNEIETQNSSTIKLNKPKDIKSQNAEESWKSKTQYIKEYAIYGFALLCVFALIIMIIRNKKLEKKRK